MRSGWAVGALSLALLAGTVLAQEAPPERTWTASLEAYAYLQQEDGNFVLPILRVDRCSLHLEARYQYENRKTFSAWVGRTFETGESLHVEVVPMVGWIVGETDGIAPGLEFTMSWKSLSLYGEAEYVVDFEGNEGNFFYYWSELGWQPTPWLTLGIAAQRTRLFRSDLSIDRGLFAAVKLDPVTLKAYGYNLDGEAPFAILSLAVDF